ncbi:MAG: hypothetical protein ACRDHP_06670 [Ktedonobacterales bacterium]
MVATVVIGMLVAWLICTAAMTFFSGQNLDERQSTGALRVRHISRGPAAPEPIATPDPRER